MTGAPGLLERASADRHRPAYHFVSPAGWLNDPNGLCQWDGVYHLFYQYNPNGALHSRIHWGHATSRDLVTWQDEPVALVPGDAGADRDGCWSGVIVDDNGVPTIVYSGRAGERELPCVATGSPDLLTWSKDLANPVIGTTPPDLDVTAFRDHCVWREGDGWRQLVGSGIRGEGGTALLYESPDLRRWTFVGPLLTGDASQGGPGDPDWTGTMWECVDLFSPPAVAGAEPLDVLVFSAWHEGHTFHPLYWTGDYRGDGFEPRRLRRLDYGGRYFYAPQSMLDETGRRLIFGWLQEGRPDEDCVAAGWSGVMSLARSVQLGRDGELLLAPVPEVDQLRHDPVCHESAPLDGEGIPLGSGDQLDVELTVTLEPDSNVAITVLATSDGAERTVLLVERQHAGEPSATLTLDRSQSSADPRVDRTPRSGPVPIGPGGEIAVRLLVDHSALEVFANGRAVTARVYPTRDDARQVRVGVTRGAAKLVTATVWQMHGIWAGPRALWPARDALVP